MNQIHIHTFDIACNTETISNTFNSISSRLVCCSFIQCVLSFIVIVSSRLNSFVDYTKICVFFPLCWFGYFFLFCFRIGFRFFFSFSLSLTLEVVCVCVFSVTLSSVEVADKTLVSYCSSR